MITPTEVQPHHALVEKLRRSQVYRDYERAFRETTGLPLALRSGAEFDLPHRGDPNENPFCALMSGANGTCASCLRQQQKLTGAASAGPATSRCEAGLYDSAVPVHVGRNLVGYLQTGQVLLRQPSLGQRRRLGRQLRQLGIAGDAHEFAEAYGRSRLVSAVQYRSILQLLAVFAQHLSVVSNQLVMQDEGSEMPAISRARAYIAEHHAETLSLSRVAQAVNMSAFYLCKTFRRSTGLTFTDYVARVRIEQAKQLLLNPHKRISEAAYEAGFQSLSQFNRAFRRIAGEPPTGYRARLAGAPAHAG